MFSTCKYQEAFCSAFFPCDLCAEEEEHEKKLRALRREKEYRDLRASMPIAVPLPVSGAGLFLAGLGTSILGLFVSSREGRKPEEKRQLPPTINVKVKHSNTSNGRRPKKR